MRSINLVLIFGQAFFLYCLISVNNKKDQFLFSPNCDFTKEILINNFMIFEASPSDLVENFHLEVTYNPYGIGTYDGDGIMFLINKKDEILSFQITSGKHTINNLSLSVNDSVTKVKGKFPEEFFNRTETQFHDKLAEVVNLYDCMDNLVEIYLKDNFVIGITFVRPENPEEYEVEK